MFTQEQFMLIKNICPKASQDTSIPNRITTDDFKVPQLHIHMHNKLYVLFYCGEDFYVHLANSSNFIDIYAIIRSIYHVGTINESYIPCA